MESSYTRITSWRPAVRSLAGSLGLVGLGAGAALLWTGARPGATAPVREDRAVIVAPRGRSAPAASDAAAPAAGQPVCRLRSGPRLAWVEEKSPAARRVYRAWGGGEAAVPSIYKAMSLRPDLMARVADLTDRAHFRDGHLDRRTKELIATYVSSLNACAYCLDSHAGNLRALGASADEARAVARQELDAASLSSRERQLLAFVKTLTLSPAQVSDASIAALRRAGWRDAQIFEAAFEVSLFAFFNRIAETYGLQAPAADLAAIPGDRPVP